jgi:very-short-patch-repair endonuclease
MGYKSGGEKIQCPVCLQYFVRLNGHFWRKHTDEGRNKNYVFRENRVSWNKGLTKETNDNVKKQSEKLSSRYKSGELIGTQKGRPLTKELRQELSKKKIAFLKENPTKVPYLLNHSSKESYPEKIFRIALEHNNINGWIQEYQNSIYSYDFAFIDPKIDVEIDGATHLTEKVKKIDERRDRWSNEQGWTVLRFNASDVIRNADKCINILCDEIQKIGL